MYMDKYASPVERRIAKAIVDVALLDGKQVSVFDGEEYTVKRSRDRKAILSALATTECDTLVFRDQSGNLIGSLSFIWGNEEDLIHDWSGDYPNLMWTRVALRSGVEMD